MSTQLNKLGDTAVLDWALAVNIKVTNILTLKF